MTKLLFSISFFFFIGTYVLSQQYKPFEKLKKVECVGLTENSSEKKKIQCMLIDVVEDSLNYMPSMSKKCKKAPKTAEEAYNEMRKLYNEYDDNQFSCWSEYKGYFCFSLNCGYERKSKDKCSFICLIYLPKGGDEFWYFVPRT